MHAVICGVSFLGEELQFLSGVRGRGGDGWYVERMLKRNQHVRTVSERMMIDPQGSAAFTRARPCRFGER
jgi:hypothetical protein